MTQYYHTIFNERITEDEVASLEERVKLAIEYERSLSPAQRAKLTDDSDVKQMLKEIR